MKVLSILGPTASGKSSLAISVAKKISGEIISCDSMQVYRGMDIGTAKVTLEEQQEIPHHLIDIYDIHTRYSASDFVSLAGELTADIWSRGKIPVLAGGSGLYARLFLYGGEMPAADRELHAELKKRIQKEGKEALLDELKAVDPETAEKVKDNERRLVRALEAVILTGEPLPGKTTWGDEQAVPGLQIINMCEPDLNRRRITLRTRKMLQEGWVEEAESLISQGLWSTPTASQSLGYRIIGDFLEGGYETVESAGEKIITQTCRYAKRQRTWFRNQHPGAVQIMRFEGDSTEKTADEVIRLFEEA